MALPLVAHGEEGSSENALQEVQASEILTKIEEGEPVEYDHVKVIGDLDLNKLDLPIKHVNRTSFQIESLGLSETSKVVSSRIRINDSVFDGMVAFNNIMFNEPIDVSGSNFTKNADFRYATFSGFADFRYATFSGDAYFGGATFNGDAIFEETRFKKDLYLKFAKYDRLYIRWESIHHLYYDDTAYQLLIENFKKQGFLVDADNSYYQLRVEQFLNRNPINDPLRSLLDLGAWIFYGFGKRPIYPILWSIFFIGLFGIFWITINLSIPTDVTYKYGLDKSWSRRAFSLILIPIINIIWIMVGLEKRKRAIDEYEQVGKWPSKMREGFSFSAAVFLSGTKLFVDPPTVPMLPGRSQSLIRRAFLFERVLGAFFSILLFIAIGTTIVR